MMKHFIRSAYIYKLCILCAFKFEKKNTQKTWTAVQLIGPTWNAKFNK